MKTDLITTNSPARVCSFFIPGALLAGVKRFQSLLSIFTILTATLLPGCSAFHPDYSGTPATDIVVTITCGAPDARFEGTVVTDGVTEHLAGNGTGTYKISGHKFVCTFAKFDALGSISISISEAGHSLGSSSTRAPSGGVRAEISRAPLQFQTLFTTF